MEKNNVFEISKCETENIRDKTWKRLVNRLADNYANDVQKFMMNAEKSLGLSMIMTIDSILDMDPEWKIIIQREQTTENMNDNIDTTKGNLFKIAIKETENIRDKTWQRLMYRLAPSYSCDVKEFILSSEKALSLCLLMSIDSIIEASKKPKTEETIVKTA